jgi:uncharacterized membrane protein YeaQ/YmgE (transglycosylase-associated protein family)
LFVTQSRFPGSQQDFKALTCGFTKVRNTSAGARDLQLKINTPWGRPGFDGPPTGHNMIASLRRKERPMTVTGIVTAIIIGAIIGVLGRLLVPGRQAIGFLVTIGIGIIAALLGSFVARQFGVATTSGLDWIELAIQVIFAAVGVAIVAGTLRARAGSRRGR